MTITNHALAGAAIALVIKEPAIALPLALISHFVLDTLPHFGMHTWKDRRQHQKALKIYFAVEALALISVFSIFWVFGAPILVYLCALIALLPDSAWWYRYIGPEKWGSRPPTKMNRFNTWHSDIQTQETIKPGMFIEMGVAVCLIMFITGPLL